jgi:mannitol/fructose-specific phosphotransferase system IIA component (Ntr-type)
MILSQVLSSEDIMIHARAGGISALAERLLRPALQRHGISGAEADQMIEAMSRREAEGSTLCGPVAIPHARAPQAREFIVTLATNPAGVIEAAGAPRLLIAFISPEGKRAEHLALLSDVAHVSRNGELIERIVAAEDPGRIVALLRDSGH